MLRAMATSSGPGRRTRNHAAYMAGSASRVSTVATTSPPMMATAMGPQNTLRDSGIMASTAAAAVSTMGRSRRTAASMMASHAGTPRARSSSIWSIRITELRWIMPMSAITPSSATKPKGRPNTSNAAATPAIPSGPVRNTSIARLKLCSCNISSVKVMNNMMGSPAAMEDEPLALSSTAPATSMR